MTDQPLVRDPEAPLHGAPVIDLAGVRVARGLAKDPSKVCGHLYLRYSPEERRVWCVDCETTIEPFTAFQTMATFYHAMVHEAECAISRAHEVEKAVLVRKVAKTIDKTWRRGMAVLCPHCHAGILPEDQLGSSISRELEVKRRERAEREK